MSSKVSIDARVVAAGPGKASTVRLTIALMPVPLKADGEQGGGHAIEMEKWPEAVHALMSGTAPEGFRLTLAAEPIALRKDRRPEAPSGTQDGLTLRYQVPEFHADEKTLWENIARSALAGLAPNEKGTLNTFWEQLARVFTEAPDTQKKDDELAPIVPTCRADGAVLHLVRRAEWLAKRVSEATKGQAAPTSFLPPVDGTAKKMEGVDPWETVKTSQNIDIYDRASSQKVDELLEKAIKAERDRIEAFANHCVDNSKGYLDSLRATLLASGPDFPKYTRSAPPTGLSGFATDVLLQASPDRQADHDEALEQARMLHLAALLPDSKSGKRPKGALREGNAAELANDTSGARTVNESMDYLARSFAAAIRSSPMLARLFRFVVDVEVPLNKLGLSFTTAEEALKSEEDAFAFLGAAVTAKDAVVRDRLLFSIAKATIIRETDASGSPRHRLTGFWPATREEVDLRCQKQTMAEMRASGAISQVNGVLDLGHAITNGAKRQPRFDIISIDPALAMETSARNVRKIAAVEESSDRLGLPADTRRAPYQHEPELGLVSAGLGIVDRWRAESVAREIITARAAHKQALRILDGDDLTVGYRVDVAVRTDGGTLEWRSLMEREIDYRLAGHENTPNDKFALWFKGLGADLEFELARRRDYDAGLMVPSARRRIRDNDEMIHAEEMVATWTGDPLGLNCHSDRVTIRPGSDVAITRRYALPSEDNEEDRKAWPLRYGWSYRFGLRPVWLGGVSLPLAAAEPQYNRVEHGYQDLAMPASTRTGKIEAQGWRRFLRHEPILPPVVLLPESVVTEEQKHLLAPQSGVRAILRTLDIDDAWKQEAQKADKKAEYADFQGRETDATWRVILPPRVSLDQAVRHGVFDRDDAVAEIAPGERIDHIAPGDLLKVDYDEPVLAPGKTQLGVAKPPGQKKKGFPALPVGHAASPAGTPAADSDMHLEDVFRVHKNAKSAKERGGAENQYYADPMADLLVIAIRPNTDTPGYGYFKGTPRGFEVLVKTPHGRVKPVAIRINRDNRKVRALEPTQEEFWDGPTIKNASIDGNGIGGSADPAKMQANAATLRLRPGEAVDVDCWFVPSAAKLRAYFDWPETLAIKAACGAAAPTNDVELYRAAVVAKLCELLGKTDRETADRLRKVQSRYATEKPWIGLAGQMADPAVIAAAADLLHEHMLTHPIPEIAAVRTLDVVHAVARPPRPPAFVHGSKPEERAAAINVQRAPSSDEGRLDVLEGKTPEGPYDGIVFTGTVKMDRDTCRQLEIRAHSVTPTRPLDDVRLGRTELQRLLGEWPSRVVPGDAAGIDKPEPSQFQVTRRAPFLYGFDVDAEGKVYLPRQSVTLLQLDQIEERGAGQKFTGLESIDLVAEQKAMLQRRLAQAKQAAAGPADGKPEDAKNSLARRVVPLDFYSDSQARKVTLTLRATSRFDLHFVRTRSTQSLPETRFPPNPDHVERWITRSSHDGRLDPFADEPGDDERIQTLWIPATIAPAKPAVHAVLPAYALCRWQKQDPFGKLHPCWEMQRRPRLRILLDRPWFSSGEGERLGIVLWPPQLKTIAQDEPGGDKLRRGQVPRWVLHQATSESPEAMELHDFDDSDLGPGGKFTTRWGADPTRADEGPMGPFLPLEALLDLTDANYIPRIAVPLEDLHEKAKEKKKEEEKGTNPPKPDRVTDTILAALATYEPRFDIESEKWFVDVALNPDRLMEPFIRLGLVRFQEHATQGLQVSAPVAAWAQILPARTAEVEATRNKAGDICLDVQISGHVSGRASSDGGTIDNLVYPRMRISVVETTRSGSGLPSEKVVGIRDGDQLVPAVIWAECGPPGKSKSWQSPRPWRAKFVIPPHGGSAAQKSRQLSVLVEEVEDYLSTADENAAPAPISASPKVDKGTTTRKVNASKRPVRLEPIEVQTILGDAIENGKSRSGPRFLSRIDFEF